MKRLTVFVVLAALLQVMGFASAQQTVERKGVTGAIKLVGEDLGFIRELNGKYKLVASQTTIEPGGYVGPHNHVGPGMRYVISGEITFADSGSTKVYKAGDFFYETGAITNSGSNKGSTPLVLITVELLPFDWKGGSTIPPKSY